MTMMRENERLNVADEAAEERTGTKLAPRPKRTKKQRI